MKVVKTQNSFYILDYILSGILLLIFAISMIKIVSFDNIVKTIEISGQSDFYRILWFIKLAEQFVLACILEVLETTLMCISANKYYRAINENVVTISQKVSVYIDGIIMILLMFVEFLYLLIR